MQRKPWKTQKNHRESPNSEEPIRNPEEAPEELFSGLSLESKSSFMSSVLSLEFYNKNNTHK